MTTPNPVWDVIIIGAGMCGLAARRSVVEQGLTCLTLEKSRGLGGRASTRRLDGVCADLGAQFTSAKSQYWKDRIESSLEMGVTPIYLLSDSQYPRYVHTQGMSRFANLFVSAGQDLSALTDVNPILKQNRILRISSSNSGAVWEVTDQNQQTHRGRSLMVTLPLPQALELFDQSELVSKRDIDEPQHRRLSEIQYTRCLSAAYVLGQETNLVPPGILKNPSPNLSGIFDQGKKGLKTTEPTVVVQAGPKLSIELWDEPTEAILEVLWKEASAATQATLLPKGFKNGCLQKWKYCEPIVQQTSKFERVLSERTAPLVLAGDAFGGSKIEGAIESGREAALAVARWLAMPTGDL